MTGDGGARSIDSDGFTPRDVAFWMLCALHRSGQLTHAAAVAGIEEHFGPRFIRVNEDGRPLIDSDVLRAFRQIRPATVMWDGFAKEWRPYSDVHRAAA